MLGHEYGFIVAATVFMASERNKLQQKLMVAGSQQGSVAISNSVVHQTPQGDYLQGCDCDLPFNIWDPNTYGPFLVLGPIHGIMTIIARLDGAVGYGRSSDPVLRSLFETCEAALQALASEKQPFTTPWPGVVAKMLARLRDCVTVMDGKDPHLARFKLMKEEGFEGVDAFAAQIMQQRRGGGRSRGGGSAGYYRSSSPGADRRSKSPTSHGRGYGGYGRGNGRGTNGY